MWISLAEIAGIAFQFVDSIVVIFPQWTRLGHMQINRLNFQKIWNEVGESDEERNNMLLQLDRECLDVYKRKVDQASNSRALLLSALANSKENLSILLSSLGQNTLYSTVSQ